MVTEALLSYIRAQRKSGVSKEETERVLLANGWERSDLLQAYRVLGEVPVAPQKMNQVKESAPVEEKVVEAKAVEKSGSTSSEPTQPENSGGVKGAIEIERAALNKPIAQVKKQEQTSPLQVHIYPEARKHSSSKLLLTLTIAFLVLMFGGGGAYAYFYYIAPSPQRVIQSAIQNMISLDTIAYQSSFQYESSSTQIWPSYDDPDSSILYESEHVGSLGISGKNDFTNVDALSGSQKFSFELEGKTKIQSSGVGDDFDNEEDEHSLELEGEWRFVDNTLYVVLTKIPELFLLSPEMIDYLEGMWVSFSTQGIEEVAETQGVDLEVLENGSMLTDEERALLRREFFENSARIFEITEVMPREKIGETSMYHYRFTLSREGIKEYFATLEKIALFSEEESYEVEELKKQAEESYLLIDKMQEMPTGELWIGQSDRMLHQFSLNLSTDMLPLEVLGNTDDSQTHGSLNIEVKFFDFNKPVVVPIPPDAKSFEEVLEGIFSDELRTEKNFIFPDSPPEESWFE